ncbi:MAG TPA: hypothetical protein VGJ02_00805, partial [Pyrinomonadaceae bacterium]
MGWLPFFGVRRTKNEVGGEYLAAPVRSVRARTNAYSLSGLVCLFLACFFVYTGYETLTLIALAAGLISFPILAMTDRIGFDGKRLYRTGIVWRLMIAATGRRSRVKPTDIIQVETEAMRALRRGQN